MIIIILLGVPASFTLQMIDSWGNNVTTITDEPDISVVLTYKTIEVQGTPTYIDNGLYEITYVSYRISYIIYSLFTHSLPYDITII